MKLELLKIEKLKIYSKKYGIKKYTKQKKIFRKNRQLSSITCKIVIKIFEDWRGSLAENEHFKKLLKSKETDLNTEKFTFIQQI